MMMHLVGALFAVAACAQQAPPAPGPAAPATPPVSPPITAQPTPPWFARLGMRAIQTQARLPVIDQVVLVPDTATYLDEISRWTLRARWPVLLEDDAFAPRFIRAFKPAAVYRRSSIGSAPAGDALRALVEAAVARAWEGDPAAGIPAAFAAHGLVPPGVVGASVSDPAWTAAVALAAGRGELLTWIEGDYLTQGAVLPAAQYASLDAAVRKSFESSGLQWGALGDDLETFTLCRNTAFKADLKNPPGAWSSRLPPRGDGPVAVTDALCRTQTGARYAFAAQIPGDSMRAAYAAMCSLFLTRKSVWMFDGYGDRTDAMFSEYAFTKATSALAARGFSCVVTEGTAATVAAWRSMLPKSLEADMILVNSAGNADFFQMVQSGILRPNDIPLLERPVALSMVHSFSLQSPDLNDTVGGRWLDHGVYAYAGSVHEPFLVAFIPPRVLAERVMNLTPFLVASRQWEGDMIPYVWRVATIGDPLMTAPPAEMLKLFPAREAPGSAAATSAGSGPPINYQDLRAEARAAMEATRTATDGTPYARAMRALVLLGDDKVAAQLWEIARSKQQGAAVARDALGPLFRTHNRDGFMQAWALAQKPSAEERDMLWAFWINGLEHLSDRAAILTLRKAVRAPRSDVDAALLLPLVVRAEGRAAAGAWLNELILTEPYADAKRRLAELQGKL